jgi:hypothetical protein
MDAYLVLIVDFLSMKKLRLLASVVFALGGLNIRKRAIV